MRSLLLGWPFYLAAVALLIIDQLQRLIDFDVFITYIETSYNHNLALYYFLVSLSALLETLFAVSFYFPGSVVLVTVLFLSHSINNFEITSSIAAIWLGINLGAAVNYYMGRYFSHFVDKLGHKRIINKGTQLFDRYGNLSVIFMSVHPNYIGILFLVIGLSNAFRPAMLWRLLLFTLVFLVAWSFLFLGVVDQIRSVSNINHTYALSLLCTIAGIAYGYYSDRKTKKKLPKWTGGAYNTEKLRVIAYGDKIADVDKLCTRFLVISNKYSDLSSLTDLDVEEVEESFGPDKCASVVFELEKDKPGELLRVLQAFNQEDISISIASIFPCPIAHKDEEYNFLVDCDLQLKQDGKLIDKRKEYKHAIDRYNSSRKTEQASELGEYPVLNFCEGDNQK